MCRTMSAISFFFNFRGSTEVLLIFSQSNHLYKKNIIRSCERFLPPSDPFGDLAVKVGCTEKLGCCQFLGKHKVRQMYRPSCVRAHRKNDNEKKGWAKD